MNHYERVIDLLRPSLTRSQKFVDQRVRAGETPFLAVYDSFDKSMDRPELLFSSGRIVYLHNASTLAAFRWTAQHRPDVLQHFSSFLRLPEIESSFQKLVALLAREGLSQQRVEPMLSFLLRSTWHLVKHEMGGKKCYQVSEGLALQLRDTELRGLHAEDLRLPYESIMIEVPKPLGFRVWNNTTGWHPAEAVYVVEEQGGVAEQRWRFMFVGSSKSEDPLDDAVVYFNIDMQQGQSLEEIIKNNVLKFLATEATAYASSETKESRFGPMLNEWQPIFNWVLNVVIYATYPEAKIESELHNKEFRLLHERVAKLPKGTKRDRLKDRLRGLDPQERLHLGRGVIYVDRREAEELEEQRAHHAGTRPTVVSRVSGHWKFQVYGPGRLLRKRIFIEPYWRNLEGLVLGEGVHRLK